MSVNCNWFEYTESANGDNRLTVFPCDNYGGADRFIIPYCYKTEQISNAYSTDIIASAGAELPGSGSKTITYIYEMQYKLNAESGIVTVELGRFVNNYALSNYYDVGSSGYGGASVVETLLSTSGSALAYFSTQIDDKIMSLTYLDGGERIVKVIQDEGTISTFNNTEHLRITDTSLFYGVPVNRATLLAGIGIRRE